MGEVRQRKSGMREGEVVRGEGGEDQGLGKTGCWEFL